MTTERWHQVKAIFDRAVECEPAERAEVIRACCGSDLELLREVESLLASDVDAGSLFENPVMGAVAMTAPARSGMIGRQIGNYIITGELAHGGMGIVYRARHVTLPRDVVVKCIRPMVSSEQAQKELRARFRLEAHIQSQLDHPHIVRVYEFFDSAEEYFLVMEYVHGASLRSILDKQRLLTAEHAAALAVQALDGLAHAHDLHYVDESGNPGVGIIHRDIKPANLLVDERANLKLTDFGIVKVLGEGPVTKTGFSVGTVEYMSPEQVRGLPLDARSDLYTLGVTLYEALSGRVPFERTSLNSDYDVLRAHVDIDPPPIRTLNPDIPLSLAEVVTRSLQKDPDQRWQTAAEFRDALISCQQNRSMLTSSPAVAAAEVKRRSAPDLATQPRPHRRRVIAAGVAALALVVAATGAGAFWLRRGGTISQSVQDKPSIAVLPFVDESPEKNQEYFSDGVAEELLNELAKTPGLRVAGRMSSFQFKGKTGDSSVIGKKLKVGAILEGSVHKQGNRARINVQLIKASDGFQLWSDTYNREMTDILAVQEEIARAVTGALKVTLLGDKTAAPSAKSTNADAYNFYLQGRYFFGRGNKDNLANAVGYFEQAIHLDPSYAPAWVGLGESRTAQADRAYVPVEEGFQKAREAVQRALVLNADLGEAHAAMGWIKISHDYDWPGADASYQRALALEPANARVVRAAGSLARVLGRWDQAIALYRRAIEIDPIHAGAYHNLGLILHNAGRQEEATAALKKALELAPEMAIAHCSLAKVYLAQSQPGEALAEAEHEKDLAYRVFALALAYHALGRKKESDKNLAELIAKFQADLTYQLAEVYAFRGEKAQAFEWLERAYTLRDPGLCEMKGDPLLKSLERDPRYAALLNKMRLPL
jgi:serine/threonine protein kinase/TolB-like protein